MDYAYDKQIRHSYAGALYKSVAEVVQNTHSKSVPVIYMFLFHEYYVEVLACFLNKPVPSFITYRSLKKKSFFTSNLKQTHLFTLLELCFNSFFTDHYEIHDQLNTIVSSIVTLFVSLAVRSVEQS